MVRQHPIVHTDHPHATELEALGGLDRGKRDPASGWPSPGSASAARERKRARDVLHAHHKLDLLGYLTAEEEAQAVLDAGSLEAARRRLGPIGRSQRL